MNLRALAALAALAAGGCASAGDAVDPATERQIQVRIANLATLRGNDQVQNIEILGVTLHPISIPYLLDGLAGDPNARIRAGCAQALGLSQDGRAVEALALAVGSDTEPGVRYTAAYNLGLFRDARGLPTLFEALRGDDPVNRKLAGDCLFALTGFDLGYDFMARPEERSAAAARWEEWYRQRGPAGVAPLLLPGGRPAQRPPR